MRLRQCAQTEACNIANSATKSNKLRGYIFQKLLLAWNDSYINKNCFFIKEMDTFGQIVAWTIYTSHLDHFTPQHTAFEQSVACSSVFLELLPGLIPFTILWHAGWTFEKTICMNMNYNSMTAIFIILYFVIIDFHRLVGSPGAQSHQENS